MKLYYHPLTPNARKVNLVVQHLGMKVDLQIVDLMKGENKKSDFLRLNPNGMVPVLEDAGFVLWESNAICQYLATSACATGLWPNDPKARADITRWQCWELAHWTPPFETLINEMMMKPMRGGTADQNAINYATERFHRFAMVLNNHLEGRKWITGNDLTLADFSIAPILHYRDAVKLSLGGYRRVQSWLNQVEDLDCWKRTVPPNFG